MIKSLNDPDLFPGDEVIFNHYEGFFGACRLNSRGEAIVDRSLSEGSRPDDYAFVIAVFKNPENSQWFSIAYVMTPTLIGWTILH